MNIGSVFKYFKECYFHDNKSVSIYNIFSVSVECNQILSGKEEILTKNLPYYPISKEYSDEVNQILNIYKKEKELCYYSFLLLGTDIVNNRPRKVVAPLFIFPARIIEEDEENYLSVDLENPDFNSEILRSHFSQEQQNEDFNEIISEYFRDLENFDSLGYLLDKYFNGIDTTWLIDFPNLFDEKKIKRYMSPSQLKKRDGFVIIPASGMAIIKKKGETIGVLNELEEISKGSTFSMPVENLFLQKEFLAGISKEGKVPNILSNAQYCAIKAASKYPISLLIGPPGTGKSYTIATMAIEHISRNKSVLIVSRTDKAVDVVAEKIEKELALSNVVVRAGQKQYLKKLKSNLEDILHGVKLYNYRDLKALNNLTKEISAIERNIKELESKFLACAKFERKWGMFLSNTFNSENLFFRLKRIYIKWGNKKIAPAWEIINILESQLELFEKKVQRFINETFEIQKSKTVYTNRNELKLFLQALRARTGAKKEDLFNQIDFRILLKAFPIWLLNMKDIYKILPLKEELFDLAIIDEATQCDIASSLPIFQRAKHVVVTGDPKQLRHISFLSRAIQKKLQIENSLEETDSISDDFLDYRKNSILDAVSNQLKDQEQVSFLNEHYRSTPAIIRFSNQYIYNNSLHIMTEKPDLPYNEGLELITCNGKRTVEGINIEEAECILERIRAIYNDEKNLEQTNSKTIGILSPFRNQVEYLKKLCLTELADDIINKHRILIGTAYEFQGEERDVMLISFSLDNDSHSMAFYHLNKQDVFNVSITRARSLQVIYCSFDYKKLHSESLVKKFFAQIHSDSTRDKIQKVNKDKFLDDVSEELDNQGIKFWKAYKISGLKVDIVLQYNNKSFGIDLIGYPGEFEDAFTIERYKIHRRAKLPIFPLPYSSWVFKKKECLLAIKKFITQ